MRTFIAVALSSTLLASAALAADVGPLAAGRPAGVKQAQTMDTTTWVLIGTGVVAAIAIGVASGSNGSPLSGPQNVAITTTTI
jgi:nitric oxide reductase large subunit